MLPPNRWGLNPSKDTGAPSRPPWIHRWAMPRTTGEALRADSSELGSGFQFLLAVPGTHFYFLSASVSTTTGWESQAFAWRVVIRWTRQCVGSIVETLAQLGSDKRFSAIHASPSSRGRVPEEQGLVQTPWSPAVRLRFWAAAQGVGTAKEGLVGSVSAWQIPEVGADAGTGWALLPGLGLIHARTRAPESSSWRINWGERLWQPNLPAQLPSPCAGEPRVQSLCSEHRAVAQQLWPWQVLSLPSLFPLPGLGLGSPGSLWSPTPRPQVQGLAPGHRHGVQKQGHIVTDWDPWWPLPKAPPLPHHQQPNPKLGENAHPLLML